LGTVPVRDMRTVAAVSVSVVTSVRLLRQHLMCRTGSFWPFRIRAATLWLLHFCACIFAPRGGPRGEPPRPDGFRPTNFFSYIRAERFHSILFFALAPISRVPQALRPAQPRRRRSPPEPCFRRTHAAALAAPRIFTAERFTGASSPLLLRAFISGFHPSPSPASIGLRELTVAPATSSLSVSAAPG
jgi:hypothetical protein